ncbi:MAG TPA: YlxR family protein [Nocardioidaceae bacterium]|nr:YlxR family protein [Nocardioidaceae bacterium]
MSRARPQLRRRARSEPVRTCVGCRERSSLTDLIRIVAVGDGTATVLVPDLRGGAPGRGAHLHPSTECLDLAERRRAFARALRLEAPASTGLVRRVVEARKQLEAQQRSRE